MPKLICLLAAAGCLLLLPACGGGGGGGGNNNTPPVIVVTGLLAGDVVNADRVVTVSVTDDGVIETVDIQHGGPDILLGSAPGAPTFTDDFSLELRDLGVPGPKFFSVRAQDVEGLDSVVEIPYEFDALPDVAFTGILEGATMDTDTTVHIAASDDVGLESVSLSINNGNITEVHDNLGGVATFDFDFLLSVTVIGPDDQTHTLVLTIVDTRGQALTLTRGFVVSS